MNIKKLLLLLSAILVVMLAASVLLGLGTNPLAESLKTRGEDVSMAVTGDVMFARNMAGVLSLDSSPFEGVSNVTSSVDLLLINFENAATTSENAVKGDIPLKCDPKYVVLAKANNNTIAALANNHAFDYGINGMRDTVGYLNGTGITVIGAGDNEDAAHAAVTKNIKGRSITVLNYMDANNFAEYDYDTIPYANGTHAGYSAYDSKDAAEEISKYRDTSDLIVAYLHFGNEYSTSPNADQIRIAHELIDNGADVVIGAHPHVPQGIEMYNGKPIFYSLGNFIFDMSNEECQVAYFVQIDLVNDTGMCTVYPVRISNFLPQFMNAKEGTSLLSGLTPKASELEISNGIGKLNFTLDNDR